MKQINMDLQSTYFEAYKTKRFRVITQYGYGWNYPEDRIQDNISMKEIPDFSFRLESFTTEDTGKISGGQGIVLDEKCKYNGFNISFHIRHKGNFDFQVNLPACSIKLWDQKEALSKKAFIGGYGMIKLLEEV